jgi:hypothetical protein
MKNNKENIFIRVSRKTRDKLKIQTIHRHTLATGQKSKIICVKYLPKELELLDEKRGEVKRSVYIREKSLK